MKEWKQRILGAPAGGSYFFIVKRIYNKALHLLLYNPDIFGPLIKAVFNILAPGFWIPPSARRHRPQGGFLLYKILNDIIRQNYGKV